MFSFIAVTALIILTVFCTILHALGKQILNLSVDRAEIILRPLHKLRVQRRRKPKRYLLFGILIGLLFLVAQIFFTPYCAVLSGSFFDSITVPKATAATNTVIIT